METRQQRRDYERFVRDFAHKARLCCQCEHFTLDTKPGGGIAGMTCHASGTPRPTMANYSCSCGKYSPRNNQPK